MMHRSLYIFGIFVVAVFSACQEKPKICELHLAIEHGAIQRVEEILEADPGLANSRNDHGEYALQVAVERGHVYIADLLILAGADINQTNTVDRTTLHEAVFYRKKDMCELLIKRGADVNRRDGLGKTSLHLAAKHNNIEIAELLISKGASVNARSTGIAYNGNPYGSKPIKQMGLDRYTPLHLAARVRGYADMCKLLLQKGAKVNARDTYGSSPLHLAARAIDLDAIRVLLDHGANINAKDNNDWTPLLEAAWAASSKTYMNRHERQPRNNEEGWSHDLETLEYLIERGADINAQDATGWTPLHYVARKANHDVLLMLIEKGANISIKTKESETVLHAAVAQKESYDPPTGFYSFHFRLPDGTFRSYVPYYGGDRLLMCKALIERGIDVNAENQDGLTPLAIARERQRIAGNGYQEIINLLISKGGRE